MKLYDRFSITLTGTVVREGVSGACYEVQYDGNFSGGNSKITNSLNRKLLESNGILIVPPLEVGDIIEHASAYKGCRFKVLAMADTSMWLQMINSNGTSVSTPATYTASNHWSKVR